MNYFLIGFLAVLSMLTALSVDIYLPTVTNIAASLRVDPEAVNASLGVFLFSYAFGQLLYGPLSDRFGRLRVLVIGLGVYAAASFLCAWSTSVGAFHLARLLQGLSACCGPITAFAVVADVFDRERIARANAYVDVVSELAPMTAPILGTWLAASYGWRSCFFFLGGVAVVLMVLAPNWLGSLPARGTTQDFRAIAREYREMLRNRSFRGYLLANTFGFGALMIFISQSPHLFMTEMRLSAGQFSQLFALNAAMLAVGGFGAARLTGRLGIERCMAVGSALIVAGGASLAIYCGLARDYAVAPVIGCCLLSTLGVALILPNSAAGAIAVFRHVAGTSSALLGFSRFGVSGIISAALVSLPLRPLTALSVGILGCGVVALFSGRIAGFSLRSALTGAGGSRVRGEAVRHLLG